MAEVITETILPGTYIEVRAEGLLSIGAVPTGNVGIIGTAEKGDGQIERLSSLVEGQAKFGEAANTDLTLVRALGLLFANGASTVYARRVYKKESVKTASYALVDAAGATLLVLRAESPGTWGNQLAIRVEEADNAEFVTDEVVHPSNGTFTLSAQNIDGSKESIGNVVVRDQGAVRRYQLRQEPASSQIVKVDPATGELTFADAPTAGADVRASYWVEKTGLRRVTLRYRNAQEVYVVPSVSYLAQRVSDEKNPSKLVRAEEDPVARSLPDETTGFERFAGGENGTVATADLGVELLDALEQFVDQDIQILVLDRGFSDVKSAVLGHVEKTENLGRERIAILGADSDEVDAILGNVDEVADKRVVLIAPGLKQKDLTSGRIVDLPPFYAAAAVAGKLSSVSPHISLTNKGLAGIDSLSVEYSTGSLKSLVNNRVLALQKKRGIRVVKGITTHDEAFKQIYTRRIIDYIKEGTRRGANQYIGKLNNARVRGALHTTLNNFLTDMVTREFLTGYKLQVFADRAMELQGEVLVTMDLNPTFSIDVIRVIMNLS